MKPKLSSTKSYDPNIWKKKNRSLVLLLSLVLFLSFVNIVNAIDFPPWPSSLNSKYGITTIYHGIQVPVGTTVEAFAFTTNFPEAEKVVFRWLKPVDNEVASATVLLENTFLEFEGEDVWYAIHDHTIDAVGDWGVQAIFYDGSDNEIWRDKLSIKATSFFSVPEIPFGTLTATLSMILALVIFVALRHK